MGISYEARRNIHVDESTWRKARILAAAFGVPVYAIVGRAITEMADKYRAEVSILMHEEEAKAKDEHVQGKRASRRGRTGK